MYLKGLDERLKIIRCYEVQIICCCGTGCNRIARLLDISQDDKDAHTLKFIDSTTVETYFSFENDLKKVV